MVGLTIVCVYFEFKLFGFEKTAVLLLSTNNRIRSKVLAKGCTVLHWIIYEKI